MPDSKIVAAIVTDDSDGLAAAYDRYADALYKYCRSMLGHPDAPADAADAADAVEGTFLVAASRLAGLGDPKRLRAWLYAVARNECMRIMRSRKITSVPPWALDEADAVIDITEGAVERAVSVSLGGSGPVQPGTPLTLSQDDSTLITLTANGGQVNWSVSLSGGPPGHQVSVSGRSSGTLQPGESAQVVLTTSKAVHGATLTVSPGGGAYPLVDGSQDQ